MRTAKKIELIEKKEPHLIGESWHSHVPPYLLIIDGETIADLICEFSFNPDYFQSSKCDWCGEEGCNAGSFLAMRRHGDSIWVIPKFDYMEEQWGEYDPSAGEGSPDCPPHSWYEQGILVIEHAQVEELYRLLPKLKGRVSAITLEELALVEKWERLVKERPVGFMCAD